MGFAGKWLGGTVAVLALVLLVSFLVPLEFRDPAPVLHVYNPEPLTLVAPAHTLDRVQGQIARRRCREYYDAAHLWRMVKKSFPYSLEEMEAPLRPGEKNFANITKDPWGNAYYLEIAGRNLSVWSAGPDAQEGTDDDISYPKDD